MCGTCLGRPIRPRYYVLNTKGKVQFVRFSPLRSCQPLRSHPTSFHVILQSFFPYLPPPPLLTDDLRRFLVPTRITQHCASSLFITSPLSAFAQTAQASTAHLVPTHLPLPDSSVSAASDCSIEVGFSASLPFQRASQVSVAFSVAESVASTSIQGAPFRLPSWFI